MTEKCINAQRQYCRENDLPMFIPSDGKCFRCGKDIFKDAEKINFAGEKCLSWGYSLEEAANNLITGCPHCYQTFCD